MAATAKKQKKSIDVFNLSDRISYLRERNEMTQKQLADAADVSQSTIAQIESGQKDPSITTLEKIAKGLDVHVAILFAGEDVHVFDMKKLRRKYDSVEKLNDTLYAALGKVVRYAKDIGYLD